MTRLINFGCFPPFPSRHQVIIFHQNRSKENVFVDVFSVLENGEKKVVIYVFSFRCFLLFTKDDDDNDEDDDLRRTLSALNLIFLLSCKRLSQNLINLMNIPLVATINAESCHGV